MRMYVVVIVLVLPSLAGACPSCYGAADSPMVDGMNAAIFGLLGITGVVLSGVVAFGIMIVRRSRLRREQKSDHIVITSQGNIQEKS